MGLENLSHFEGIKSERSFGKPMFQVEVVLIQFKTGTTLGKSVPTLNKSNLGTCQPQFSLTLCHSLVQSSISPYVGGRIARQTHYLCFQPVYNLKTNFNPCQSQ